MEIKVKDSKIDIGLSKLILNNKMLQKCLHQQASKQLQLFYEIRFDDGKQRFRSEQLDENSIQNIMEWSQTFSFELHTGFEKMSIILIISSIVLGEVEVDRLKIDMD